MHIKLFIFFILFFSSSLIFAEICPDVSKIKNHLSENWKAYDDESNAVLTPPQRAKFINHIAQFSLAEWTNKKNRRNSIHCYYNDTTGSHLEAYLAQDNFVQPQMSKLSYWYAVTGSMHCAASTTKCIFHKNLASHSQFAKK